MKLHIVTRYVSEKDESLRRCYTSIQYSLPGQIDWEWYLVGKGVLRKVKDIPNVQRIEAPVKPQNDWGYLINLYLDVVPNEGQLIYFLDGDNLLHRRFSEAVLSIRPDFVMMVMDQEVGKDQQVRHGKPENLVVQKIDIGQVIFSREFIKGLRTWSIYRNDGYFIQELSILAREYGKSIQFFGEVASCYNAQLWKIDSTSQH